MPGRTEDRQVATLGRLREAARAPEFILGSVRGTSSLCFDKTVLSSFPPPSVLPCFHFISHALSTSLASTPLISPPHPRQEHFPSITMKFPVALILAFLGAAYAQTSSTENPFNNPANFAARAGQSVTISWNPTTSGTISLYLRSGASSNLIAGVPIATNIPNSGSYTWNVPSDVTRGSDYALEIRSATGQSNYTPQFVIESSNTVATNTNPSSGATVAPTSSRTMTVTVSTTSGASVTTPTGSTSTNSGSSSSPAPTSSRVTTGQATPTPQSTTPTGAAPRATAAAGIMGALAMAAFAL